MELVCIGGPSDGARVEIPKGQSFIHMRDPIKPGPWRQIHEGLELEDDPELTAKFGPMIKRGATTSTYVVNYLWDEPTKTACHYLAFKGASAPELLTALLAGYRVPL